MTAARDIELTPSQQAALATIACGAVRGGTITLLDAQSLKVDGVAYTRADAQTEGRPVVFR